MDNFAIDHALIEEAYKLTEIKTKTEIINIALKEFIQKHKADDVISMFGQVEYDNDYNYKALRTR